MTEPSSSGSAPQSSSGSAPQSSSGSAPQSSSGSAPQSSSGSAPQSSSGAETATPPPTETASPPPAGRTLLVGPSNVGKTHHTAAALAAWVRRHGPEGVVVLEFAPAVVRDGRLLGGRLDRFHEPSPSVWRGTLAAHAPRADGDGDAAALALARDNATRAARLLDAAPANPRAVFVNDATIPFQSDRVAVDRLRDYCAGADCVVANAFESDELGTDDPVSTHERVALRALRTCADRVVRLPDERPPWDR